MVDYNWDARCGIAKCDLAKANCVIQIVEDAVKIIDYSGIWKTLLETERLEAVDELKRGNDIYLNETVVITETVIVDGHRTFTITEREESLEGKERDYDLDGSDTANAKSGLDTTPEKSGKFDGPRTPDIYDYRYRSP